MKKYIIFFISCFAFCGCKTISENKQKGQCVQMLKINLQGDPTSLHPFLGIDLNCRCLQKAVFEGLTRVNGGVPELAGAEKIDISEDQLRYTFTLRPHKWSNGEEVKAKHFENNWKKGIAKASNCLRPDLFYIIKNAKKAKKGEVSIDQVGIYAKDDKTLVVDLEHPAPYFLDLISNPLFAPQYDDSESPTVFNGPFIVESWEHERQLALVANPYYWDRKNVRLKEIEVVMVKDPYTVLLMYEKGEIDLMGSPFTMLPLDSIPHFEKKGKIHKKEIYGAYWISCNTKEHALSSPKIRKALSYAINRKLISQHVLHGETPSRTVTPPYSLLEEKELYNDGDIAAAQRLFNEGLKDLGLTKKTFPPLKFSHSDVPGQKPLIESIAREWEKIFGIKTELQGSEWNVFFANLASRQFQLGGCIYYFLYNDPSYPLEFFKDLSHRYNSAQWENKEYQHLLELVQLETNSEKRKEFLKKAEKILLEEMPVIPLYFVSNKYLMNERVKDVYISDLGHVDFKWAYVQ